MKTRTLKQLLLYNYRYIFAYVIIIGFVVYFLGWQLGHIGPGLSAPEISTAARHLSFKDILNLPIYPLHALLQWVSIQLFGITIVALRLPSVIIAFLLAVCLYKLLKKCFGKQTALLCTAIFISADWFLFTARLATGSIEFSFWLALALLCFTKLLEHKTQWLVLFCISLVGLLFAPLGPYAALVLFVSLVSCRVFRQRAEEANTLTKVASVLVLAGGVGAIVFFSIQNIAFLKNIFNVTDIPTFSDYFKNLIFNTSGVVAVLPDANAVISPSGVFFVRFFELIFIAFGVAMLWKTRINRLNLTILILSVVLVLASGLSAGSRGGSILLVPAAIYMTAGVRHFMHRWKRTFPKNPYARVAAFVPLGLLFICVVALHYVSYFQLWPNQTATRTVFNHDLVLVQDELNRPSYKNLDCFVGTNDVNLQKLITASATVCRVSFTLPATGSSATQIIQTGAASIPSESVTRALVSETEAGNVRWVVVGGNSLAQ